MLAHEVGWVDVNKNTLQHNHFPNIFSLGDASSLPTSRTGAAIRKQTPVVVENLLALINHKSLAGNYAGYTSCPLVTGYGKLVLAELITIISQWKHFRSIKVKKGGACISLKQKCCPGCTGKKY